MNHLPDILILELAAGNVTAEKHDECQRHLESCPDCRQRVHDAVELWDDLGTWQISSASPEALVPSARFARRKRTQAVGLLTHWRPLAAAAAIVLASVLGHWAGLHGGLRAPAVAQLAEPGAAEALHLDELDGQNTLTCAVLWDCESDPQREHQP